MKVERRLPDNRTPVWLNLHHLGEQLVAYIYRWSVQIYLIYYLIRCTLYLILAQFTPLGRRGAISCIRFNSSSQRTPTHWFKWQSKPSQQDLSKSTNQCRQTFIHTWSFVSIWSSIRFTTHTTEKNNVPNGICIRAFAILRGHVEPLFSNHVLFQSNITLILKPTRGKGAKRY